MSNERGLFEVLVAADRSDCFLEAAATHAPLDLTGFWRRRSGFNADGSRHFIWPLILISWAHAEEQEFLQAA